VVLVRTATVVAMFPSANRRFVIEEPTVDPETGDVELHYGAGDDVFVERWSIGAFPVARLDAVTRAAQILAVCGSTSYYKALYGAAIDVDFDISPELLHGLIGPGLAEFRFENEIPLDHMPAITVGEPVDHEPLAKVADPANALVALGGGKDSIVAATALIAAGRSVMLCAVNPKSPMTWSSDALGLPLIGVRRVIDPHLFRLNDRGAPNGHIPITAITSAGLVLVAAAHGFAEVVFANESSANVATFVTDAGFAVNHQYSKSQAFETLFGDELKRTGLRIDYYSAIRGLTEVAVCKVVGDLPLAIQQSFTSCNTNFNLASPGREAHDRWCGICSKCAFVFLSLAPFIDRPHLTVLFGKDLLLDESLEPLYMALAADAGVRPLECIGTTDEVRWALQRVDASGQWSDAPMVARLATTNPESDTFDPFPVAASGAPAAVQQALEDLVEFDRG